MAIDRSKQTTLFAALLLSLLLASCGTFEIGIGSDEGDQPTEEIPTELPTPVVLETQAPQPPVHIASGLSFTNNDGIWLIDREGAVRMLIDKSRAVRSPDGQWFVYEEEDPVTYMADIWLMDITTGERRNITNTPDRDDVSPRWVPGRPEIVLFGSDVDTGMMNSDYPTTVRVDGSSYEILDQETGGLVDVSPDGEFFFYGRFGETVLMYNWDTGKEVFNPADFDLPVTKLFIPAWSPDGSKLAWYVAGNFFGDEGTQLGIAVFDLNAGTSVLIHAFQPQGGSEFHENLSWSPDGEWLAFTTSAEPPSNSRAPNFWVSRPDGSDEEYLGMVFTPIWRYDSAYLTFAGWNDANTEVINYLVEVGTWEGGPIEDLPLPDNPAPWEWVTP